MGALKLLEVTLLLNLLSGTNELGGLWSGNKYEKKSEVPPTCKRIECPSYEMIHQGNGYEIRRYNSSVWISTSPVLDISLVQATRTGFLQLCPLSTSSTLYDFFPYPVLRLFDYIQGKNEYNKKIEMTGPVITQVSPSDGPFCESSFIISFYVPKENQADPPPAEGLHVQRWDSTYVAVRQFGGFVSDDEVGEEAAALQASLAGSIWEAAIGKSSSPYIVAQYNSPFEFKNRVNEIWLRFDMWDVAV